MKELFPRHRWEQIEERNLPFADLPQEIDVLVGLGVTRGHHPWAPQQVFNNVCYLLARYVPRACFFESALDYYADILEDLHPLLLKVGYSCWTELFETDLPFFPRRKILVAQRGRLADAE